MTESIPISYGLLEPANYKSAVELMLKHYLRYEKACQLLNLHYFPNHDHYAETYFYDLAKKNCSIEAVDGESGELVGVMFNSVVSKDAATTNGLAHSEEDTDEWDKLLAVYKQNKTSAPDLFDEFKIDKYFYLGYVAVEQGYGSKGIASNLVQKSTDMGKTLGCKLAIADVTAVQTKHICVDKMHFQVLGEMKYKDFVWKGEKILGQVDEKENLQLVVKAF